MHSNSVAAMQARVEDYFSELARLPEQTLVTDNQDREMAMADLFPIMIERFARLREHVITERIRRYTHHVTCVWIVFFLLNGSASAWTALWGSREQWMLYNGVISYGLIAALFGLEFLLRQRVRARD